jgi:thiol-disulfide isomerase/thioredoxin
MYKIILPIILILIFSACSNHKDLQKRYTIEGKIQNLDSGSIILEKLDLLTNERAYVSTSEIKDGQFSFNDTISGWGLHSLVIHDTVRIPFFIEPGRIQINIPDHKATSVEIKAGINNELFVKHNFTFEKLAGITLIETYPSTVFSAFTTYYVLMNNNFEGDTIENLVKKLSGQALESVYMPHIHKVATAVQTTNIGKIAPNFVVADSSGKEIQLSELKGKYVLLDFWTSWCKPCREANPKWKELYNEYKSDGLEFLGVSFDVKCQPWIYALQKDQLPWLNGCNCKGWDEISDLYGVKSVPQTFFIDPDGKILNKNIKPEEFESILEKHGLNKKEAL